MQPCYTTASGGTQRPSHAGLSTASNPRHREGASRFQRPTRSMQGSIAEGPNQATQGPARLQVAATAEGSFLASHPWAACRSSMNGAMLAASPRLRGALRPTPFSETPRPSHGKLRARRWKARSLTRPGRARSSGRSGSHYPETEPGPLGERTCPSSGILGGVTPARCVHSAQRSDEPECDSGVDAFSRR